MKKKNLLKAIDKNKTREIRHLSRKAVLRCAC